MRTLGIIFTGMRPSQWVKNTLIFAPLLFAHRAFDAVAALKVFFVFALFCLLSGGIYLVNDVLDRRHDAEHPEKKKRPVAAGDLSPAAALAVGLLLGFGTTAAAALVRPALVPLFAGYILLNLAYTLILKNIVILDVMSIAAGFLLRVVAGALAIPVPASFWLMICTALLALFLALGKRRHEMLLLEGAGPAHRPVLREYSPYLLDQMISLVSTSTVLAYALYSISPEVSSKLGTTRMGLTIPFVLYGVLRYLYLIHRRDKGGDPTQEILRDLPLMSDILLWGLTVTAILYFS